MAGARGKIIRTASQFGVVGFGVAVAFFVGSCISSRADNLVGELWFLWPSVIMMMAMEHSGWPARIGVALISAAINGILYSALGLVVGTVWHLGLSRRSL